MVKLRNGPDIVMVQIRRKETKYHNEHVGMQKKANFTVVSTTLFIG